MADLLQPGVIRALKLLLDLVDAAAKGRTILLRHLPHPTRLQRDPALAAQIAVLPRLKRARGRGPGEIRQSLPVKLLQFLE